MIKNMLRKLIKSNSRIQMIFIKLISYLVELVIKDPLSPNTLWWFFLTFQLGKITMNGFIGTRSDFELFLKTKNNVIYSASIGEMEEAIMLSHVKRQESENKKRNVNS